MPLPALHAQVCALHRLLPEHDVSLGQTLVARPLDDALRKYLRWPLYYHR